MEIGQPCFFRETLWRQKISNPTAWNSRNPNVALMSQPLEIEIRETQRDAKFGRKRALSGPTISIELTQE